MSVFKLFSFWLFLAGFFCSGCSLDPLFKSDDSRPDKLTIKDDGTMEFRNRKLQERDVIIYPDGTGGERAAIKVYDPMHPDYYRDSIRVERSAGSEIPDPDME